MSVRMKFNTKAAVALVSSMALSGCMGSNTNVSSVANTGYHGTQAVGGTAQDGRAVASTVRAADKPTGRNIGRAVRDAAMASGADRNVANTLYYGVQAILD